MSPRNAQLVNGKRFYTFDGVSVPSVTSILTAIDKPALRSWYANQVAELALGVMLTQKTGKDAIAYLADADRVAHEATWTHQNRHKHACDFLASASRYLAGTPTRYRDAKGERGTAVHEAAEHDTAMDDVPENARKAYGSYQRWLDDFKPTILAKEFQVFNEVDSYGGSGDLIAVVNGIVYIIDLKTSRTLYHEMRLQLAAYRYAGMCINGSDEDWEATTALERVEKCALLHLTDDSYEFVEVDAGPLVYSIFLTVREVFDFISETDGAELGVRVTPVVEAVA